MDAETKAEIERLNALVARLQSAGSTPPPFTGLDTSNWMAPAPTNLMDALNRIAHAIKVINGGNPIA